jgi:hypothetical protein
MPKRKVVPFVREAEKTSWNLYGLQALAPDRFTRVVEKILSGKYLVFRPQASGRDWF